MEERIDVISKGATYALLQDFLPRLAFGGHTHHGCYRKHSINNNLIAEEYSIPSFNCRNRLDPSFMLVSIRILPANNDNLTYLHYRGKV